MPVATCPDHDSLRDFHLGKLPLADAQQIAEHLDACPACQASIETIGDSHDTLVHSLRQEPVTRFDGEPDLQKALAAVEALGTRLHSQTASGESGKPIGDEALGTLRDYHLLEKLGEGGMGTVYKARHQRLKRTVALKLLPQDRTRDKRAVARFEREMEAVGKLEHPNIVRALDAGEHDGTHYLVMEYVDGLDLSHVVKGHGPLAVADACELVRQTAAGLQSAHEHALVHRDVKPSNLMLTAAGQVKVLDLGLALLLAEQPGGDELTGTSQMMGTADYCAPEQVGDSHTVDIRADIYSLGCTLYKLLTGHAPFSGQQFDTAMKKLMAHISQPVRPVRELRPDVPQGLAAVLDRMLAKQPAARYSTPAEVLMAIAPFAAGSDLSKLFAQTSQPIRPAVTPTTSETTPHLSSALTGTRPGAGSQGAASFADSATQAYIGNRPPRRSLKIAAAAAAFVLLAGVVIVIKNRKGEVVATVEVKPSDEGEQATADTEPSDSVGNGVPSGPRGVPRTSQAADKVAPTLRGGDSVAEGDRLALPSRSAGSTVAPATAASASRLARLPAADGAWPPDAPPPAVAPFDEDQARKHQQAWADHLNLPLEHTNSIGMKFILIPPGEFSMGSTPEEIEETLKGVDPNDKLWQECIKSEAPQHKVVLTRPFYLGVHEVTQKEYEAVMGTNPSYFTKTNPDEKVVKQVADLETANHPVEVVSWNDAAEFCAKLSKQEEMKPFYFRAGETVTPLKGTGYRLPTEAEWEFACRAGTTTRFWIGDREQDLVSAGWYGSNSGGRTHEAGELGENPFGVFDVHGNVWEWVEDAWEPMFYKRFLDKPAVNPTCPFSAGARRVIRGGSWNYDASSCRSAFRYAFDPTYRPYNIGFRVVLVAASLRASR
ncbi:MAG TPA: SUMF1/EgtB/PvdO family nonheme iron enzyme [Pirellulales bacterium]|nr:SUMF1/EgtB/PvdO family nonheme iron enzyme [Pirellulales bacterium]